jgi:hypothetical protein
MVGGEYGGSSTLEVLKGVGRSVSRCDIFRLPKYVDYAVNSDVLGCNIV